MLQLKEVTLVMVETREHKLARMAMEECLKVAEFGDVLVLTDRPSEFWQMTQMGVTPRIVNVPDWPEKVGWSRAWWFDVPPLLRTSQTLNIQWDSWICDPSMWRDDFLRYDFIGAPWWYRDGKNVGNGGFSLKSTRLARYIWKHRDRFPVDTSADDDLLCRKYRHKLEDAGFLWAPEKVAHDFAFECCRPSPTSKHFGMHGMFNWPFVLDDKQLKERVEIALDSPYIRDGYMMKALCENHPGILQRLAAA